MSADLSIPPCWSLPEEKLLETLNQVEFTPLQIPYVTNVTAEPVTDIRLTKELLKAAGIIFCALAAEHGVYAGKRSGYLCGDRTGPRP